jgi:hypothetical protein
MSSLFDFGMRGRDREKTVNLFDALCHGVSFTRLDSLQLVKTPP